MLTGPVEVADGVLDLGVAAVIGFELDGAALAVGDKGVVVVSGQQRQLGTGGGLDPPHDETDLGMALGRRADR